MKRASLFSAALMLAAPPALAADLTLALSTRATGGRIAIAIYRDADAMRRGEGAVRTALIPRTGRITMTTLSGLAPGRYAVAVFHDTDGNGRLSTWPIGLPKEAYGFSRNARSRFGPPAFDAAAFDLPAAGSRQEISLR
ncbi:MAG: DUF2141 domain-containing protein [Brevundimonas sp.]|uniref:DUF2141 domain-containing protein n=1 Tax=Brevundimonas sp. TaxID=1871086 RepID=UPI00248952B8|nr:DUF2141 domain-containing protein [Brevundimonas sp.]MDI1327632.1 DUF2141 domain-containing protein [Brevundimonas sp.]